MFLIRMTFISYLNVNVRALQDRQDLKGITLAFQTIGRLVPRTVTLVFK